MASITAAPPRDALDVEQRFVIHGVAWKDYVVLREALDIPGLRMTFCRGALGVRSPSTEHERIKKSIARLLELYSLEREVVLHGYGSTTFRKEVAERGLEPDECYTVGELMHHFPDLAIEVVLTHGGIKKLEAYRGLGVSEVWLWEEGELRVYQLQADGYQPIPKSALIPGLDLEVFAEHVRNPDGYAAARAYRDWLRTATR